MPPPDLTAYYRAAGGDQVTTGKSRIPANMLNLLKLKQEKADAKAAGAEGDGVSRCKGRLASNV